eukprot:8814972-Pyramimonas_sp.AAC.1
MNISPRNLIVRVVAVYSLPRAQAHELEEEAEGRCGRAGGSGDGPAVAEESRTGSAAASSNT